MTYRKILELMNERAYFAALRIQHPEQLRVISEITLVSIRTPVRDRKLFYNIHKFPKASYAFQCQGLK